MPAKKKQSKSPKKTSSASKTAAKKKSPPAKKAAVSKKAAPAEKARDDGKAVSSKKAPAKKKTGSTGKRANNAAKSSQKDAPAKKATASATKKTSENQNPAAKKKTKRSKDTPAIFKKVLPKKSGPSNFTLDDIDKLLKTKTQDAARKKEAAAKSAPVKRTPAEEEAPVKTERRSLGAASINDILGIPSGVDISVGVAFDEEVKVPKRWLKYYRSLIELRDQVNDELQLHASETLKRSSREDSGDLSGYGQHQADVGTDTFDRDLALSMVSSEQDALYEIEQAIQRIKDDTYGTCEITGKPINKARLSAVPFTRYSVEGQAQWERTNRRKADRGGGLFGDGDEGLSMGGGGDVDDDE